MSMMRGLAPAVCALLALGASGAVVAGGEGAAATRSDELLVKFRPGAAQQRALAAAGAETVERLPVGGLVRVRVDGPSSAKEVETALERRADVAYAEPNRTYELSATPNDPDFGALWGLARIGAPVAWNTTTGSDAVTVAVVDSGVDYAHEDLASNIWSNPGEIPGNGVDDDGNGLRDDVRGWDYYAGDADPQDQNGHGTHVAGTIGARGNNGTDVVGVNWRVRLMPLRAGNSQLTLSAIVGAFSYACAKGARVVNGSFGGSGAQAMYDAIAACPNTLFVFAAGNDQTNNDLSPTYPCAYPLDNVVCVAASTLDDARATFSNWGAASVDLAAPGVDILSTTPGDDVGYADGTSMAAPHVAGAAALVLAQHPAFTARELRSAVLLSVDRRPALAGVVATGGRLNVARALEQDVTPPTGLTASSPSHGTGWSNNPNVQIVWSGATDPSGIGGYSYAFSQTPTFVPDEVKDAEPAVTTLTMPLTDGEHWFHVRARDGAGNWGGAVHVGPIRIDTFAPVRPVVSSPSHRLGAASADRTVAVAWSGAFDGQSGLDGYSLSWTIGRAGAPDLVKELEETAARATSPQLAVGSWWFNIRARDNAGNWSDAVSIGPFLIRSGPTACAVPRLRGLTLVAAKRLLVKRGCALGRVTRVRSRRVLRGRVVAQRPAPGLRLRRGARIRVSVSRGRR